MKNFVLLNVQLGGLAGTTCLKMTCDKLHMENPY